jgi:PadR family transcriptional regulator, regulatory protein PadR
MKLTGPLERVLRAFLADPSVPRYGYDLMKASGLPSGTLYPLLSRLQEQGLVSSAWAPADAGGSGRPPRRYYRLTEEGIETGRQELARASAGRAARAGRAGARGTGRAGPRGAGRAGPRGAARPARGST